MNFDHRNGIEFFRDVEARPLPAMRLFSLCDVQLLSAGGLAVPGPELIH